MSPVCRFTDFQSYRDVSSTQCLRRTSTSTLMMSIYAYELSKTTWVVLVYISHLCHIVSSHSAPYIKTRELTDYTSR